MQRGSGIGGVAAPDCPVCHTPRAAVFTCVDTREYRRCGCCDATFLNPRQLPDRVTEHAQYRLHRNDVYDAAYRRFLARLATPLLERLTPGQDGLDYGCGPGPALAAMLLEAGYRMRLYDPLFRNDTLALKRQYDFVTCTEVVEHFHYPAREFARLDGLLKPGGWLGVMTGFMTGDAGFAAWHYRRDPTHVVFYRPRTFQVIAERNGWRCEFPATNIALLQKAL